MPAALRLPLAPVPVASHEKVVALKYTAVSGNQMLVERRALVDAYEYEGYAYMMVGTATATKWEASEKRRVELIVESFLVGSPS